jgi:tetratricopeptide (TPR) repeat protein
MTTTCDHVRDELSALVDGDRDAIARHAEHLAGCDACRDARHDAARLVALVGAAGLDHLAPDDLVVRVLAAADREAANPMAPAAPPPAASDEARGHTFADAVGHATTEVMASVTAETATGVMPAATTGAIPAAATAAIPAAATAAIPAAATAAIPAATTGAIPAATTGAMPTAVTSAATAAIPAAALSAMPAAATAAIPTAATSAMPAAATAAIPAAATAAIPATATAATPATATAATAGTATQVTPGALIDQLAARRPARPAAPKPVRRASARVWLAIGASAAIAAGATGLVVSRSAHPAGPGGEPAPIAQGRGPIGTLTKLERAAADGTDGVTIRIGDAWQPLRKDAAIPAGAELRTDDRTRASVELGDGTRLVLDHSTRLAFRAGDARQLRLAAGRLAADVTHVEGHPAAITTPTGRIDVVGTRFSVTATDAMTSVQVTRGAVVLSNTRGEHDDVRAGEEGVIERGALAVSAAPGLVRDTAWAELAAPAAAKPDEVAAGLGALRAYKPGETRDRDWNLALAAHDVKIRVVGPVARTEITETFRNDSAATLEGVYQFPLPPDAQIDSLALDVAGGFIEGAFLDKERGAKIWRGVIDKAAPRIAAHPSQEIIWVEGRWRDPALLDWKRGGRFELRVYPIPAHGSRTIKLAYTQIVTPRGSWRQYSYPLPHSRDGSTVADQFTVDVELRGAQPGLVRTAGYDLVPDPARAQVNALTLRQAGFVPRGDLVIDYRAADGDAELRAWTFAGGAAAAPDDKLATKQHVGIDPKVIDAQRAVASDLRPTAVVALHPKLPRWRDGKPRDYLIAIDGSQSMVGERFTRATELATELVAQMDRRDRFNVMVCDSECRAMGDLRTPSQQAAGDAHGWLAALLPAGASDVVASLRAASATLGSAGDREPWILYIGDGFASTGFRRVGDVERALAGSAATSTQPARIATIGIGSDADAAILQAAARGGGGSYLAWVPGQRAATAAAAVLESTVGAALRDAVVELPAGLSDVAPTVLPTIRAGEEVLIAARMTGEVAGDVIVRGRVAGQPFEQRYPLTLAVSAAPGNGFVPRLWAQLAIDQLERAGASDDRARIVALSQGYGVMSRETSLLVLESQAMFDAFGVDRSRPTTNWTGEEALDEVASSGTIALDRGGASASGHGAPANKAGKLDAAADYGDDNAPSPAKRPAPSPPPPPPATKPAMPRADKKAKSTGRASNAGPGAAWVQMRRVWVRSPSVTPYDTVHPSITKAIGVAEAALAASPDSREKHRALVQALSYAGELGRARDVATRWLERDQLDPQALGYLADLLGRDGQRERALRTLAGLVDLDADRVALHERMVHTYEQVGRLAQACGHRIALAALQPKLPLASAGALRCLRSLGRDRDAELILHALPDDASRAGVEKAALVTPLAAPATGDLVVKARWDNGADLDVTLVTPDGTRVSWMGGRTDVATTDVTSTDHEQLAIKTLRRGNYLLEISRTAASPFTIPGNFPFPVPGASPGTPSLTPPGTPSPTIRGTLDIVALGAHRSIPFELTGARTVVGRVSIRLEEHFEDLDGTPVQLYNGPDRRIIPDRQ